MTNVIDWLTDDLLARTLGRLWSCRAASVHPDPCSELIFCCVPGSKAECVRSLEGGSVTRFNPKHDYPQGCTDYDRWKRAQVLQCTTSCLDMNL